MAESRESIRRVVHDAIARGRPLRAAVRTNVATEMVHGVPVEVRTIEGGSEFVTLRREDGKMEALAIETIVAVEIEGEAKNAG